MQENNELNEPHNNATNQPQEPSNSRNPQTVFFQPLQTQSNGLGIAGFVLSIVAIFFGWIPLFGWTVWLLGLVFSAIGVFKKPNGLAIAGLAISLFGILLLLFLFSIIFSSVASQNLQYM